MVGSDNGKLSEVNNIGILLKPSAVLGWIAVVEAFRGDRYVLAYMQVAIDRKPFSCMSSPSSCTGSRPTHRLSDIVCVKLNDQMVVLTTRPVASTNQRSLANGFPLSRATIQSAINVNGNGPRLVAGTLPTE
jgi:hypothetical protein